MPREKILSSRAYWFEKAQNELFRQFHYYMEEEKINQTQLAERLCISKGRVSQILRGESNFTMKTLIDLALSIRKIAKINYVSIENEVQFDELKRLKKHNFSNVISEKKTSDTIAWMTVIKDSAISTHTSCDGRLEDYLKENPKITVQYSANFKEEVTL
ncbi:MAG TPA: helix-turn-helix transcriptional regulator [Mucilaginibacter sp.]